jgi:hypothetical protein
VSAADTSGQRASLTDEQRERIEGAVRRACVEIDRETAASVRAFVLEYEARQRRERLFAIAMQAAFALTAAAALIVALVCLAALAARLAGGAS